MVWMVPAVAGIVALAAAASTRAQDTADRAQDTAEAVALADQGAVAVETDANPEISSASAAQGRESSTPEVNSAVVIKTVKQANGELASDRDTTPLLNEQQQAAAEKLAIAQRRSDLSQQFAKLRKTLETEDSFSLRLAEDYFSYGMLLRDNGDYDEAVEAFVDALHIQKVNHGIYSPEQRPILKALFDTHYALGNVEDFEDYLERILWVEAKNPNLKDDFSFKMLLMVGNQYIDEFLKKPIAGQNSVQTLLRAKHHLNAAFTRHKDKPLTVAVMPYGELALISFLESQLFAHVDKTSSLEDPRLRSSQNLSGRELALASYLSNSFPRGTGLLKSYLKKAQSEENLPHVVSALIALGDFNQLFRRHLDAAEYYQLAWQQAQNLAPDHELLESFEAPIALPAFQYALEREPVLPTRPTVLVPLKLGISPRGRVTEISAANDSEFSRTYFSKARRLAKRLTFRPRIVAGELLANDNFAYQQRVYAKKKKVPGSSEPNQSTETDQAATSGKAEEPVRTAD